MKKLLLAALLAFTFPLFVQGATYTKTDYAVGTQPVALAIDKSDNVYVVNGWSKTISKITTGGTVTTVTTLSNYPNRTLVLDSMGNLYVAIPNTVIKLNSSTGQVMNTYVVGKRPMALAFDTAGNLYVADGDDDTIRKITPAGTVSVLVTLVKGSFPTALAFDAAGNLYVANMTAHTVNKINASTSAIMGTYAVGTTPMALAFDAAGNLYVTNAGGGGFIKKITATGAVSTLTYLGATAYPQALAFDTAGNLYVADNGSGTVVKITFTSPGVLGAVDSTFATVGTNPYSLAFDTAGNLYVANWWSNNVTKLTLSTPTPVPATPSITITSPNGGETLTVGQTKSVTWDSANVDTVNIAYLIGGGHSSDTGFTGLIVSSIPNTGKYDWVVNTPASTEVKIRIFGTKNGISAIDDSNNFFTVVAASIQLPPVQPSCPNLVHNMRTKLVNSQGATVAPASTDATTNNEVSLLQNFLITKGFLNAQATGYFGMLTFNAVKAYQASLGWTPTGYVGAMTRGEIKKATCGTTTTTSTSTLSPGCTSTSGYSTTTGKHCSLYYAPGSVPLLVTNTTVSCVAPLLWDAQTKKCVAASVASPKPIPAGCKIIQPTAVLGQGDIGRYSAHTVVTAHHGETQAMKFTASKFAGDSIANISIFYNGYGSQLVALSEDPCDFPADVLSDCVVPAQGDSVHMRYNTNPARVKKTGEHYCSLTAGKTYYLNVKNVSVPMSNLMNNYEFISAALTSGTDSCDVGEKCTYWIEGFPVQWGMQGMARYEGGAEWCGPFAPVGSTSCSSSTGTSGAGATTAPQCNTLMCTNGVLKPTSYNFSPLPPACSGKVSGQACSTGEGCSLSQSVACPN